MIDILRWQLLVYVLNLNMCNIKPWIFVEERKGVRNATDHTNWIFTVAINRIVPATYSQRGLQAVSK